MAANTAQLVLADLLRTSDRVASVYIGQGDPTVVDLGRDGRWAALADRLRADGADAATISAVEEALVTASPLHTAATASQHAVFASRGAVRHEFPLPGFDRPDEARNTTPVHSMPLLRWLQDRPPYVLATVDGGGVEIEASAGGLEKAFSWSVVTHDGVEVTTARTSGAVTHALHSTGAQMLLLAGDEPAVRRLRERLPAWARNAIYVTEVPGGPCQPVRPDVVDAAIRRLVRQQSADMLSRLSECLAADGAAVAGAPETIAALGRARVSTLLLVDDESDTRTAWFGRDPTDVALAARPAPVVGEPMREGLFADVVARSALLTGAWVHLLPKGSELPDGIGGLCRFD
jgi:hypothetical protein